MQPIIKNNLEAIINLCKEHYVAQLYVFGSATSNLFNEKSDIDFLYDFNVIDIDFNNLENAAYDYETNYFNFNKKLKKILKRKIDLVPIKYLKNKYLLESINASKQLIYNA